jgi:1-deoxyxylulose-5-phosphate synthase
VESFGRGLLTRPRAEGEATRRGATDHLTGGWYADSNHEIIDVVEQIAGERSVPMARVALSWVMSRPGVTAPVVGATRLEHLEDAAAAIELELDETETARLDEGYRPRSVAY